MLSSGIILTLLSLASPIFGAAISNSAASAASCPGYFAYNVKSTKNKLTASLKLAGKACNVYGTDVGPLSLLVEYQTTSRLHVKIYDSAQQVYQVPESVLPSPSSTQSPFNMASQDLVFSMVNSPFSFSVSRKSTGEILFDTSGYPIIFESQYLGLRTQLPDNPNIYGLGEDTDPFRRPTTDYTRTLWSRDAYGTPTDSNLYGNHPVYFDHRGSNGTHAVFFRNSNGMDIKINNTQSTGQYLEYNTLGGVLDFYFLSGPTPKEVAIQYAATVGLPAMMPYWGFGFHQCRYGMVDVYEVAGVVANYSVANIPLETMWMDIDYMNFRRIMTTDPLRFPLKLVQQFVNYLHDHQQHYVVMVDPAVAFVDYPTLNNGIASGAYLRNSTGGLYNGVVWPGPTVFPDWFAPGTQGWWNAEFYNFFSPSNGLDIDALWIDMNEASNFCAYPCTDPLEWAKTGWPGDPPRPPQYRLGSPYPVPGWPKAFQPKCVAYVTFNVLAETYSGEQIVVFGKVASLGAGLPEGAPLMSGSNPAYTATLEFQANAKITYSYLRFEVGNTYVYENSTRTVTTGACGSTVFVSDTITSAEGTPANRVRGLPEVPYVKEESIDKRASGNMQGLPGRDLVAPMYTIANSNGAISANTINTSIIHHNGLAEYDTHNLYGTMMSEASRYAMINRRPTVRPMVITRSTFAGAGRQVGHWLGDNVSDWDHYRISIAQLLEFAALFQVPMVGSDVCGYAGNTNEQLCSRWAMLGAFSSFYRNHDGSGFIHQEFYQWPTTTLAAQKAIAARYQLLDYIYTAMYLQTQTGEPMISPMFFMYPNDTNTFSMSLQYFYGPAILVAPVTEEDATSVDVYMPVGTFYDYWTGTMYTGTGAYVTFDNLAWTDMPLFYKGGSVIPLRINSANTTKELRKQNFNLIVAPDSASTATGSLYLDEGNLIVQPDTSMMTFSYSNGVLTLGGTYGYNAGVTIAQITLLGVTGAMKDSALNVAVKQGFKAPAYDAAAQKLTYTVALPLTDGFSVTLH